MGKLTGICLIMGGCFGLLLRWREVQKKRQAVAGEFVRLLARWEYGMERERVRLFDFLESYESVQPEVGECLSELLDRLRTYECPSGEAVWRQVLAERRELLHLDNCLWEILFTAGSSFFGLDSRENLRTARVCRRQMEEQIVFMKAELEKRTKVYMPVGMLAGVLLVILLI